VAPFAPLTSAQKRAIERAAAGYGTFLGKPVEVEFSDV